MTATPIVRPRSLGSSSQSTESLLQHFYFIAAVVIVVALVILRIIVLRRRNQALSNFFRMGNSNSQYAYGSYPPYDNNLGSMYHGIRLAPLPPVYRPDRRTRAADIDEHGRRLGSGEDEVDGKDVLPPYDNLERLPKYVEAGWSHAGPLPLAEQSAANQSPEGEQSGTAHTNTADGVLRENAAQPVDDIHVVSGVTDGSDAPSPPPVHANASRV